MPLANRTRAGRRDCGGGAPFCAALRAALCAMRSRKRPCQPKTAKRFFGGPGSHGPSGQAKERTRILPVRRGFSAPNVPRRLPGLAVLARPAAVMRAFVPGVPAFFPPVCRCLVPGLRLSAVFCLARAAAARRLCAELPAGGPAFCGFVPGPRASPPAGFVRIFAPAAFLPAVRFLAHIFALFWLPVCLFCAMCAGLFSTCFFALS